MVDHCFRCISGPSIDVREVHHKFCPGLMTFSVQVFISSHDEGFKCSNHNHSVMVVTCLICNHRRLTWIVKIFKWFSALLKPYLANNLCITCATCIQYIYTYIYICVDNINSKYIVHA